MNLYKNRKIAILRGYPRMIDGESTSVEEMYNWSLKNDLEIVTYYYHPIWKRNEPTYKDKYQHKYKIFNYTQIENIKNELNKYDLIILLNFPKMHSGLKAEDIKAFFEMYKDLKPIKIQMQHTSFLKAINETPYLWAYLNFSDAIYNHSAKSYYIKEIAQALPSKKDKCYPMHLWIDINKKRDFEIKKENSIVYIGRFVLYKGPKKLLDLSEKLKDNGFNCYIYGMDTSMGCKHNILNHKNCNNLLQKNLPRNENPIVDTYPRIANSQVIDIFSNYMFAWVPFKFSSDIEQSFYGDRMEYTMQEAILAGSILIVNKQWAQRCRTKEGKSYITIDNFAVIYDEDNPDTMINQLKEISKSKELQTLYRQTAFEVLKNEYDTNIVLPDLFNQLFLINKDNEKFQNLKDLVFYLTQNQLLTNEFIKLYNSNNLLPMCPRGLAKDMISMYGGLTGKKIIKITK